MLDNRKSASQASSSPAAQKPGGTGRRASRAGTRRVSALTSAQLERKRANDRAAQRATRQRTREHIESLEARMAGLSVDQELVQNALRLNKKLELQNAELRAQLDSVEALFSAVTDGLSLDAGLGHDGDSPLRQSYAQLLSADNLPFGTPLLGYPSITPVLPQTPYPFRGLLYTDGAEVVRSPCPVSPISSSLLSGETTAWRPKESILRRPPSSDTGGAVIPDIDWTIPAFTDCGYPLESNGQHNQSSVYTGHKPVARDEMCEPNIEFMEADVLQLAMRSAMPTNESSRLKTGEISIQKPIPGAPSIIYEQPTTYGWELPIRHLAPTCPIDDTLLSFIHDRRLRAVSGMTGIQLIGPKYPSISPLLDPKKGIGSHPVSRVLTDILGGHPGLTCVPEKVAVLYVMYLLLQWQISPTPQTFCSLPEWLCPRASQLVTPHPIWMDQIPWPRLRDRVINSQEAYSTFEFQGIFTRSICVNWRHQPMDALVLHGDEIRMNLSFERHVRRLENWSLGPAFMQRYPELVETIS